MFKTTVLLAALLCGMAQASTETIVNDVKWLDTDGNEILVNKGGHVTKFGDTYYWVGVPESDTDNLRIYTSKTLASDSWTLASSQVLDDTARNATMLFNPTTNKYVIVSKANGEHGHVVFYESDTPTGTFNLVNRITPENDTFRQGYEFGGMSVYQEGNDAYFVVARRNLTEKGDRHMGIFKLNASYTAIESEVYWKNIGLHEAPWVFKKDGLYYMSMSGTKGWDATPTYYMTATNLAGPWTTPRWAKSSPWTSNSYNTQHRWIMKVGEQWMFSGDRYVQTKPSLYDPEKGRVIMVPVSWDDNETPSRPVLNWQKEWSLDYDGDGLVNNVDTDDDGDGILDVNDSSPLFADSDNDGIENANDNDDDNDGIADTEDAFPQDPTEAVDTDGDGIGDNADTDANNDGVTDLAINLDLTQLKQQVKFSADITSTVKKVDEGNASTVLNRFIELGVDSLNVPIYASRDLNDPHYDVLYRVADLAEDKGLTLSATLANTDGVNATVLHGADKFNATFQCGNPKNCKGNIYNLKFGAYADFLDQYLANMEAHDAQISALSIYNADDVDALDYSKVWSQMSRTNFTRVGVEQSKLTDSTAKTSAVWEQVDIIGSGFEDADSIAAANHDSSWAALKTAASTKPVWFTQSARTDNSSDMNKARSGLENFIPAIRGGAGRVVLDNTANNMVWYNGGRVPYTFDVTKLFIANAKGNVVGSNSEDADLTTVSFKEGNTVKVHITNKAATAKVIKVKLNSSATLQGAITSKVWNDTQKGIAATYSHTGDLWSVTVPANAYVQMSAPLSGN